MKKGGYRETHKQAVLNKIINWDTKPGALCACKHQEPIFKTLCRAEKNTWTWVYVFLEKYSKDWYKLTYWIWSGFDMVCVCNNLFIFSEYVQKNLNESGCFCNWSPHALTFMCYQYFRLVEKVMKHFYRRCVNVSHSKNGLNTEFKRFIQDTDHQELIL